MLHHQRQPVDLKMWPEYSSKTQKVEPLKNIAFEQVSRSISSSSYKALQPI